MAEEPGLAGCSRIIRSRELKDPRDRIREILDRTDVCARPPEPESVNGCLPPHDRGVLERLEAYRPETPEDFTRRVLSSLPNAPGRSRIRRWGRQRFPGIRMAVPVGAVFLAASILILLLLEAPFLQFPFLDDAPVARTDSYTVECGGTLRVTPATGVLANDMDPDTARDRLEARLVCPPSRCSEFFLDPDGGFFYRSDGLPPGNDTFTYRPFDGRNYGAAAAVVVKIL